MGLGEAQDKFWVEDDVVDVESIVSIQTAEYAGAKAVEGVAVINATPDCMGTE